MSGQDRRLVQMLNQIGQAFRLLGLEPAAEAVREHVVSFWAPRMRRRIVELLEAGGEGLDEAARLAVTRLPEATKATAGAPPQDRT